jgi:hypothetical protein
MYSLLGETPRNNHSEEVLMENALTQLTGLFALDHSIRVYVPGTVAVNSATTAAQQAMVEKTLARMSEWFGGATAYDAMGAWMSPAVGLVTEKIRIVEAYCTAEQVEAHLGDVLTFCRNMRDAMSQEAIAMEYDNKLYFI